MTRFTKRNEHRPENVADPCRQPGSETGNDFVLRFNQETSECYLLCEIGDDLYATMLFPIRDEIITITLLLGPVDDWDDGMASLSTAMDLFEKNTLFEGKQQRPAKPWAHDLTKNSKG
jgi:hypothetical protein